ncbi:MAG TPA: hypothetical protein VM639_09790 [Dongiaceae bacterium]|nr:hypothetical protein [Dongiaceae bacterium]
MLLLMLSPRRPSLTGALDDPALAVQPTRFLRNEKYPENFHFASGFSKSGRHGSHLPRASPWLICDERGKITDVRANFDCLVFLSTLDQLHLIAAWHERFEPSSGLCRSFEERIVPRLASSSRSPPPEERNHVIQS